MKTLIKEVNYPKIPNSKFQIKMQNMQNQVKPSLLIFAQRFITTNNRQFTLQQKTTEDKTRQQINLSKMTLDQDKILVTPNLSRTIHPSSAMIFPILREANLPEGRDILEKCRI